MTFKDEEEPAVMEIDLHGGEEETDDGEEECLLTEPDKNTKGETSSSRRSVKKTDADYYYLSSFSLQFVVFIWVVSVVLFYQLGQWKCQTADDASHVQNLDGSFQLPSPTLKVQPIPITNGSALSSEDEIMINNNTNKEEAKENELVESAADAQDVHEPSSAEIQNEETLAADATTILYVEDEDNPHYVPHLPFGEGRKEYRRVCTLVHSSELCLTLRFPFAVEPQDPKYEYPHPVDERMYELAPWMYMVDGNNLLACRNATVGTIDEQVMACLERFALSLNDPSKAVVAVWTRTKIKPTRGTTDFYGVLVSEEQGRRIDEYFDKHVVLVLGASPAPAVTECLSGLFGRCQNGGIKPVSNQCEGHTLHERELGNRYTYGNLPDDKTFIGVMSYLPNDGSHGRYHSLSAKDILAIVKMPDFQRPDPTVKRKLSLIIEHPIAHVQNQNMIREQWDAIETIQHGFPQQIMNIYTPEGRKILSDAGWEPGHVIAFDGIPQFNPTQTGAFEWSMMTLANEEKFIANNGYEGWLKDYGTQCRGPLPPQSTLKKVNDLARQGYTDAGLDLKFYGRTWEFANQFWFVVKGWTPTKGLDCTHAKQFGTGLSCVHKYFLQLMVDDHYESMEEQQR